MWAADQPERTGCQRRLALRARRRWRGRCAPGRLRQPSHFLAPRARRRRTPRARAPTCAPPVAHVLLGMVGIDDVVHCALLESSGGRDLSFSRGRGRGGTPRGPQCRLCHTPAERQHYGSWHEGGASSVAAAPRSRVTGAPKLCQPRFAYSRKYEDCLMRSCVPAADLTTDTVTFSPNFINPRSNSYRGLTLGNEQNRPEI